MLETNATNLPRLINCNGSHLMGGANSPIKETDNTVRDEGVAAHYMAYKATDTVNSFDEIQKLIGEKSSNGVYMTQEMGEFVESYLNEIRQRKNITIGGLELVTTFETEHWRVNARCDNASFDNSNNTLYIDDFKYGWRLVEPNGNWALIAHAIGFCIQNELQPTKIIMTIHQPRPGHPDGKVRSWECNYQQLMNYYQTIDTTLCNLSHDLNTGLHCAKCPSLYNCPAATSASMNAIEASEIAFEDDIDNERLSFEIDALDRAEKALKSRLDALRELAQYRIKNGEVIKNYSIDKGFGNRTWNKNVTREFLKIVSGQDLSNGKLITPAQAIKKGIPEASVMALSYKPEKGTKLVRVDANKKAERIFKS